ncbi:MAG: SH3 domain-containing protein [Clostridia bacterium]
MKRMFLIAVCVCCLFTVACNKEYEPVDKIVETHSAKPIETLPGTTPESIVTETPTPTIKPTPIPDIMIESASDYCFTIAEGTELKDGPLENFGVIKTLSVGTEVKITGSFLNWFRVEADGADGYIETDALAFAKGFVSAEDVNMRKGPGRDSEIIKKLPEKTEMIIFGVKDEWLEIIADGEHGYIHKDFVGYEHAYVTADEVKIRSGPSTDSEKVGLVYEGDMINVLSTYNGWYRVEAGEYSGFVFSKYVREAPVITELEHKRAYITDAGVNFRKGPSTDFSPFKRLNKFTAVTVTGEADLWYRVFIDLGEEEKTEGFVSKEFIEFGTPTLYVTSQDVSLRTGPGSDYTIITKVRKNSKFVITESEGDWFKGVVNGVTGYMSMQYLDDTQEGEKTNEFSEEEVYLAAKVAYLESRGGGAEAYAAVANVIYNRVKSRMFPNTIESVCFQRGQFSVIHHSNWNNITPNSTCLNAVRECLNGGKRNVPMRVLFFHAAYLGTSWGNDKEFYKTIGANSFFWYIG